MFSRTRYKLEHFLTWNILLCIPFHCAKCCRFPLDWSLLFQYRAAPLWSNRQWSQTVVHFLSEKVPVWAFNIIKCFNKMCYSGCFWRLLGWNIEVQDLGGGRVRQKRPSSPWCNKVKCSRATWKICKYSFEKLIA